MDPLLSTLLRNAAFLVVMLPVVGALLVGTSAWLGTEAARRTAQANALITAVLAVVMSVHCIRSLPPGESISGRGLTWLGVQEQVEDAESGRARVVIHGPDARIAFAVDGLNVWFAVGVTLMMFAVLSCGPRSGAHGPAFYALLLLLEASILGALLAADVLLFAFCSEAAIPLVYLMIGGWGGFERRTAANRWLVVQAIAGAAVVVGLVLLVLGCRWTAGVPSQPATLTFAIDTILTRIPAADGAIWAEVWNVVGVWAFRLLLFGFLLRAAVVPLHTWLVPVSLEAPASVNLLLTGAVVNVGLYGLARFVVPLFPPEIAGWGATALTCCIAAAVFTALLALAQGNLLKFVGCVSLANLATCAGGLFVADPAGRVGAVLLAVHHAVAVPLLLFVVVGLNDRFGTADVEAFGGLARRCPRRAIPLTIAVLALVGVPLSSGFPPRLLLFHGVFASSVALACWLGVATLLLAWAGTWTLQRILGGRPRIPTSTSPTEIPADGDDLSWASLLAAAPLGAAVLLLGVLPGPFVDTIERTVAPPPDAGATTALTSSAGER